MSTALYLSIELDQLDTAYLNLDSSVMDIVSNEWETNQLELWHNDELVRNEVDIEETEFYITQDGEYRLNTCLYIYEEIDNIEDFVMSIRISDFMIHSHLENMMFDAIVKGHKLV